MEESKDNSDNMDQYHFKRRILRIKNVPKSFASVRFTLLVLFPNVKNLKWSDFRISPFKGLILPTTPISATSSTIINVTMVTKRKVVKSVARYYSAAAIASSRSKVKVVNQTENVWLHIFFRNRFCFSFLIESESG